jgi:hypothetical protein
MKSASNTTTNTTSLPVDPLNDVTAGVDWARDDHAVSVVDSRGREVARCTVVHSAAGLRELVAFLGRHGVVEVAIERPYRPSVVKSEDTPQMRSLRGRIAAYESWARTEDRAARTWPARKAALDRFERQVDPAGVLTQRERAKRAEWARRAYMQQLALKSAAVRQRRKLICQSCGEPRDAATPMCAKCLNDLREP